MIEELKEKCEPLIEYLKEHCDPHQMIIISDEGVRLVSTELWVPSSDT